MKDRPFADLLLTFHCLCAGNVWVELLRVNDDAAGGAYPIGERQTFLCLSLRFHVADCFFLRRFVR